MREAAQNDSNSLKLIRERQTSVALMQNRAESLISAGLYDSAITLLCGVLMIEPSRVPAIHNIGRCLEEMGAKEDAISCYRGTLPDSLTEKYFASGQIRENILSASASSNVTFLHGFDEERIKLTAPVRNSVDRNYGQFSYKETYARPAFCTVAEEGYIWFDRVNVVALDKQSCVIEEQTKGNVFSTYHAIKTTEPQCLNGTACFLDGRSSNIYYHWMLDILPKIGVMQSAGISLDEIDYFIVVAKSKFQLDTLRACGIREDQLVIAEDRAFIRATRMIVPNLKNDQGEKIYHGLGLGVSTGVTKYLNEVFSADHSNSIDRSCGVKVYISRSTRGSRNIANEPALIDALELRGFQTVEFEGLSVSEQAELMSRADVVVGVHGAGFTNLSFCNPGTQVIEIFGDYVVPCYWALSAVLKLDYAQFMASSVDAVVATGNPGERVTQLRDMEIEVNTEEFIDFLDEILGTASAAA